MKINIITKNNGVGLWLDYLILKEVLEPKHEVNFIDFDYPIHKKADVSIHLEHITANLIPTAPINIFIPNPEWYNINWNRYLPRINQIWCKTHETERIFKQWHKNCIYTSFTSKDCYLPEITKDKIFFHNRGKSSHKGTYNIIEAWRELFGKLYINSAIKLPSKKGIIINTQRLTEQDLKIVMNGCMFHICTSEAEGFGHYINEAKSVGAIIISTNAAPMNELVTSDFGKLINVKHKGKHNQGVTNYISAMDLTFALNEVLHLSEKELSLMSNKARQSFLNNDKFFRETIKEII